LYVQWCGVVVGLVSVVVRPCFTELKSKVDMVKHLYLVCLWWHNTLLHWLISLVGSLWLSKAHLYSMSRYTTCIQWHGAEHVTN